ncbi:response regulator [Aeromonas sp. 55A]|uniref:response regulator n=1 Tax=Aeromonas sp. 55A TaxID=3452720 RepID=UPI0038E434B8
MFADNNRPILIIDDCSIMSNALRGMLQKMGYSADKIDLADTAKMALALCAVKYYQLLVLDFNLGNRGINGYQLLVILREEQLLPADCVTVVLTAEASLEMVRSFQELEPDSYLIKPISYKVLSQRLGDLMQRQRRLRELMIPRREQDLSKVLAIGQRLIRTRGAISLQARFIMAEACLEAGDKEQAHHLLIGLKKTSVWNKAHIRLAQMALQQADLPSVFALVRPLQEDPLWCGMALTIKAEAYALQQQPNLALDSIRQAIALSPRSIERYWLQAFIEMAVFDLTSAKETALRGLRFARFRQHEEESLQQLLALLYLDLAACGEPLEHQTYLGRFRQLSQSWHGSRSTPMTQSIEAMLQAHAAIASGNPLCADSIIEQHRQLSGGVEVYQMGLVEELEWEKLMVLPTKPEILHEYYLTLKNDQLKNNKPALMTTMKTYISQWQASIPHDRMLTVFSIG